MFLNPFLIGFCSVFFLLIRLSNYFLLITPFFYYIITKKIKHLKKLLKNIYYYLGVMIGALLFIVLNLRLYGKFTLSPISIYNPSNTAVENFLINEVSSRTFVEFFYFIIKSLQIILISNEFGLVVITPTLFISLLFIVMFIFKKQYYAFLFSFLIYSIPFGTVVLWQSTASSFGYRYLYVLIPYSILIIVENLDSKIIPKVIYFLFFISVVMYLFFETSNGTSLSRQTNTFGRMHSYVAPEYISEVINSISSVSSYLHIIFTSFFGVFIIKLFILFIGKLTLISTIEKFNYLNQDVLDLIEYSESINVLHFFSMGCVFYFGYVILVKDRSKIAFIN